MEKPHHSLDYIEFSSLDQTKAQAFYTKVFGWRFVDYGPDYCAVEGQRPDVGFQSDATEAPAMPLVIFYSHDLLASKQAIIEAGGLITKDIFAFPGGRRFQFKDPSGNELAIWSDL